MNFVHVARLQALKEGALAGRVLSRLAVLVLDEADLLLSYGHEADLQAIAPQVRTAALALYIAALSAKPGLPGRLMCHPVPVPADGPQSLCHLSRTCW